VLGVDLTEIHGLGPSLALKLIGECGTDLRAWPTAKHFTSWLCLALLWQIYLRRCFSRIRRLQYGHR
jgi:transposase